MPASEGRALLLHSQRRPAEPERALLARLRSRPSRSVLLDPNTLSADGTVALSGTAISDDGKRLAYGLASAGSDWQEWKVRDVETGKDLDDHLKWVKFSGASWTTDGTGFFYSRYDEPTAESNSPAQNYYQKLYFHRLGTPQSEDRLVYERPDHKDWGFAGEVTDDGHYLIIDVWQGTDRKNPSSIKDLDEARCEGRRTADRLRRRATTSLTTTARCSGSRPIWMRRADVSSPSILAMPAPEHWNEIVPRGRRHAGRRSTWSATAFFAAYLKDAHTQVHMFELDGSRCAKSTLPGLGRPAASAEAREDTETFYAFTSFTVAGDHLSLRLRSRRQRRLSPAEGGFRSRRLRDEAGLLHEQGRHAGADVHHRTKGLELDGTQPDAALRLRRLRHLA